MTSASANPMTTNNVWERTCTGLIPVGPGRNLPRNVDIPVKMPNARTCVHPIVTGKNVVTTGAAGHAGHVPRDCIATTTPVNVPASACPTARARNAETTGAVAYVGFVKPAKVA